MTMVVELQLGRKLCAARMVNTPTVPDKLECMMSPPFTDSQILAGKLTAAYSHC